MPVDPKSLISVTHLVHITGPLHDVLEGSLTRDIIYQEDSLKRDVQRFRKQMHFKALQGHVKKKKINTFGNINMILVHKPDYHLQSWQP